MATNKNFLVTAVLTLFLVFAISNVSSAQISCAYPSTSNLPCDLEVTFEFTDGSCAATCGPITIIVPSSTTQFLTGAGCCAGAVEIHFNITGVYQNPSGTLTNTFTQVLTVYGGCTGTDPTSETAGFVAGMCTSASTPYPFTIATSPTGAIIW